MDEMIYNADGTIQNRRYFSVEGPEHVCALNPFQRVEAETMAWSEGVKTHFETEWEGDFDWARGERIADRLFVTSINHGDYIMVQGVDLETRSEEHTSELQSRPHLVCRLLLEKKNKYIFY